MDIYFLSVDAFLPSARPAGVIASSAGLLDIALRPGISGAFPGGSAVPSSILQGRPGMIARAQLRLRDNEVAIFEGIHALNRYDHRKDRQPRDDDVHQRPLGRLPRRRGLL
jgi:hypothetical protein